MQSGHIFISYAREDRAYVRALAVWLTRGRVQVWMDDQVPTAELWETVLIEQISTCRGLLVVMSPEAGASRWVAKEVQLAIEKEKPIHPLLLRGDSILGLDNIQHEDVSSGGYPSQEFLSRLAGIAPLRRVVTHMFGLIPPQARFFQQREVADQLEAALVTGGGAILTSAGSTSVLSGLGGVGKTQLAADLAQRVRDAGATDIVLWVTASSREAVLAAYSEAAVGLVPGADSGEPERAAGMLLGYLSTIAGRWLMVLDDVQDPAHLDGLWPPTTPTGQVVATTRRTDDALARHGTVVTIEQFTPAEASAYLEAALAAHPVRLAGVQELALELGYLPLALSQAAAYINDRSITCVEYLARLRERQSTLTSLAPETLPEGYPHGVATTISLSVEAADQLVPAGMAGPLLQLLSLLDPNGIPRAFTTADASLAYLAQVAGHTVDLRDALSTLTRLSLATLVEDADLPLVRVHAIVQRVVRDAMAAERLDMAAQVTADALLEIWPGVDTATSSGRVLRANTEALRTSAGDRLYRPGTNVVLLRAGTSLREAGLVSAAIDHLLQVAAGLDAVLGSDDPATLLIRHNLAGAFWSAGRVGEAIDLYEQVLEDRGRVLGPDHPDSLRTRSNIAIAYEVAGQLARAIATYEAVMADQSRLFGPEHPDTLRTGMNLALAYQSVGRVVEAVTLLETVLLGQSRAPGSDHPDTLRTGMNLAVAYQKAGRVGEAVTLYEHVLADELRVLGPDHPYTLATRHNLADAYLLAGRMREAIGLYEAVLADKLRVLGRDHPDSLLARRDLAEAYRMVGRVDEAVSLLEAVVADMVGILGPDHPDALGARNFLATAYRSAGQLTEAVTLLESVLADQLRVLHPGHPYVLATREALETARAALPPTPSPQSPVKRRPWWRGPGGWTKA